MLPLLSCLERGYHGGADGEEEAGGVHHGQDHPGHQEQPWPPVRPQVAGKINLSANKVNTAGLLFNK